MLQNRLPNATRHRNVRSRATNNPRRLAGVDGRSVDGRRRRDLIEAFVAALGGWGQVDDMQLGDVRRAAELYAIAEEARSAALKGRVVDLAALVRIEGAADRAVRRLKIIPGSAKAPSLEEHLAKRAAERAGDQPIGTGVAP
jgi:hypothetical protein